MKTKTLGKKNKIYLFIAVLFFVSVFFVGVDSVKAADNCACEDGTWECACEEDGYTYEEYNSSYETMSEEDFCDMYPSECVDEGSAGDPNADFNNCNGVGDVWDSATHTCQTYSCDPGWSLVGNQCVEDNYNADSADFSAYCDTHPDDSDCQQAYDYATNATTESDCSRTGGSWMNGTCYDSKDDYCAEAMGDVNYTWSTLTQSCTGGNKAACSDSSDCGFGFDCDPVSSTCKKNTLGNVFGVGGTNSALGNIIKTNLGIKTSNGTSLPSGTRINTATGVATLPNGTTIQIPQADLNAIDYSSNGGGGNLSFCGSGMLGQICSTTAGGSSAPFTVIDNGAGLAYPSDVSAGMVAGCGIGFEKVGGVCFPMNTGLSSAPIYVILSNIFSWLMGLFTTLAVIAFVLSGLQYLTSAGNEDQMENGKNNAKYAIIGIVVGLSGFVVVKAIAAALSGQSVLF